MRRFPILGLLVVWPVLAGVDVPLTIREALYSGGSTGIARTNEPLTVGVPIPDSAGLTSTSVLGLTGATSAQFTTEARWPSGNIKWVKVRAIIPNVPAGGTSTVTLTSTGSGNFGGANLATDNGTTITVSTGVATFTIKKANFNVVDRVVIGTTTVVAAGASQGLVVLGPNPGATYPANVTCSPTAGGSPCTTAYSSANDATSTAVIEENGPAMAVIRATGDHSDGSGHAYLHYTARLYFYKDKAYLKVTSILRNADRGGSNTFASAYKGFQGYELRIAPNISGTLNYTFANHTGTPTTGTLNAGTPTDTAYLYQAESTLMNNAGWCGYGCVPYTPLKGYSIMKNGTSVLGGSDTQYPQGWADISDASGVGVEIGHYQLAAYGSKSLEFNNGGRDVRLGIWARQNNNTGTSSAAADHPYYMPWPQWSINDVYINFHASSAASLPNDFLRFQHYLLAAAPIAHYNLSKVFFYPLLDAAEEDAYYANVVSTASPSITAPTFKDLGTSDTYNWPLTAWKFYAWAAGGISNQMEFRLSRVLNFIRRGHTGSYLDSAHFYKFAVERAFPMSDGFDWRSVPGSETQYLGFPVATSANQNLGIRDWVDTAHAHMYGMPDYYLMSGDETIRDGVIEGAKDAYLSTNSNGSYIANGWYWAARDVGVYFMTAARLNVFLKGVGDSDAQSVLNGAQKVYNAQVQPDFCAYANYPTGCVPDTQNDAVGFTGSAGRQRGVSRVRGIPYQWGATLKQNGCPTYPTDVRGQTPFMVGILLQGLWEIRQAMGPGWANYDESFDLGYGMAKWAFNEMFADDGTSSWSRNGFRYTMAVDFPNNCNIGSGGAPNDFFYMVQNPNAFWPIFYFRSQYEGDGTTTAVKRLFNQSLQRVIAGGSTIKDELFHYTVGEVIYAMNHPIGISLNTVPATNVQDNGGGSYTLTWNVPSGATRYRIKWNRKSIVDWIGFDAGTYMFIGNPASSANWFASTDAAGIPAPAGTTQTITINTGVTGLTAGNFMIKAYVNGSGVTPPPPPPPTADTTAPTASITAPAAGVTISGTVMVSVNASDNVGLSGVQLKLDGSNLGSQLTGPGPSYSYSWNTAGVGNGSHTLVAVATDSSGNTGSSSSITFTVSNAATDFTVSAAPSSKSVTAGSSTTFSVAIAPVNGFTGTVTFNVTGLPSGVTSGFSPLSVSGSGSPTLTLTASSSAAAGSYSLTITATSGSTSHTAPVTLVVGGASTPPAGSGGTTLSVNTWTGLRPHGPPTMVLGYDRSVYVGSRKIHCLFGGYHEEVGTEPQQAMVCYSYAENRWFVLQNNGVWHTEHQGGGGHTQNIFEYMPDRDVIVYQTDGSGSNVPEKTPGRWWWFDVGGLSGQDKTFSPRPWLGVNNTTESLVYDSFNGKLVLFPDNANNAVQICDPGTNTCSAPSTTGTAPPGVGYINLVYNSNNHKNYAFVQGDIYTFEVGPNRWTKLAPTCSGTCVNGKPAARQAAGFAYSSADNIFLLVGGTSGNFSGTAYRDTWVFDPVSVAWREQTVLAPYPNTTASTTFDRLTYDADSNVFVLMTAGNGGFADGSWGFYPTGIWVYAYSAPAKYGRSTKSYTPPAGSLNRVVPTSSSQSWVFDPAITASGSALYAGWIETGEPFDETPCGYHHPYIQSASNGIWTGLPAGTQAAACLAIDPEPSQRPSDTDASKLLLAVVNGKLWEVHEKSNFGVNSSAAWAKSWTGSSWAGGQVGCFTGTCSTGLTQYPVGLAASGSKPTVAVIENNHAYVPESYFYVAQWNGTSWAALGGKLNVNGAGTKAMAGSLASDGTNPAACWTEEVSATDRKTLLLTPQVYCSQWNGSSWSRLGGSLNRAASGWAASPTIAYAAGKYYIGWTERTTGGNNNLYVCRWDGSSCTLLGGASLNITSGTSWAAHPSLATDGTNVYVAWEEQAALGEMSIGYVKKWNGTSWSSVGGALNADPVNGSVEGISMAVVQGAPVAIWGELVYGNLRQAYVKQWNGSAWTAIGGAAGAPPVTLSCDINSDGKVDQTDVQLAINQALGITPCGTADLHENGVCNVIDVQRVINASLGKACVIGQ